MACMRPLWVSFSLFVLCSIAVGVLKNEQAGYAVPPILGNPLPGIGLHKTVEGSAEKSALFGVRPGFKGSAAGFSAANSGMIFE